MTRADVEPREPRCRICRHESVRIQVNQMLDWRGVPTTPGQRSSRKVTSVYILRILEPLNGGRDEGDRITYDSLWVHAKRHYEIEGIAKDWATRMPKDLRRALGRRHS